MMSDIRPCFGLLSIAGLAASHTTFLVGAAMQLARVAKP